LRTPTEANLSACGAHSISFITAGFGLIFRVAMSLLQYHKDCYGVGAVSKRKAAKGKT
jgi:hypothetical protein